VRDGSGGGSEVGVSENSSEALPHESSARPAQQPNVQNQDSSTNFDTFVRLDKTRETCGRALPERLKTSTHFALSDLGIGAPK
jgi:hypothetical protein